MFMPMCMCERSREMHLCACVQIEACVCVCECVCDGGRGYYCGHGEGGVFLVAAPKHTTCPSQKRQRAGRLKNELSGWSPPPSNQCLLENGCRKERERERERERESKSQITSKQGKGRGRRG